MAGEGGPGGRMGAGAAPWAWRRGAPCGMAWPWAGCAGWPGWPGGSPAGWPGGVAMDAGWLAGGMAGMAPWAGWPLGDGRSRGDDVNSRFTSTCLGCAGGRPTDADGWGCGLPSTAFTPGCGGTAKTREAGVRQSSARHSHRALEDVAARFETHSDPVIDRTLEVLATVSHTDTQTHDLLTAQSVSIPAREG